jgi:hypothetical protein
MTDAAAHRDRVPLDGGVLPMTLNKLLAAALVLCTAFAWRLWRAWSVSHRAVLMQRDIIAKQRSTPNDE